MRLTRYCLLLPAFCTLIACNESRDTNTAQQQGTATTKKTYPKAEARQTVHYRIIAGKKQNKAYTDSLNDAARQVLAAVNRTDLEHLVQLDTLLVPEQTGYNMVQYSPFPQEVPELSAISKLIVFSYPSQFFAAYEEGHLVRTGPTNMGRQKDPTPEGLYFCNWKAEQTRSTFNDEWELKWNFNIENKEGIGFHQYALPGYPASHSCLRLNEADARFLYEWADQWNLKSNDEVEAQGTPVLVWGTYPFGAAKPWYTLASDPHALEISAGDLAAAVSAQKQTILKEQENSQRVNSSKARTAAR